MKTFYPVNFFLCACTEAQYRRHDSQQDGIIALRVSTCTDAVEGLLYRSLV